MTNGLFLCRICCLQRDTLYPPRALGFALVKGYEQCRLLAQEDQCVVHERGATKSHALQLASPRTLSSIPRPFGAT